MNRPENDLPDVLTLPEAAQLLRISETTLRDLVKRGRVPGEKVGVWRFSRSALMAMLAEPHVAKVPKTEPEAPVRRRRRA